MLGQRLARHGQKLFRAVTALHQLHQARFGCFKDVQGGLVVRVGKGGRDRNLLPPEVLVGPGVGKVVDELADLFRGEVAGELLIAVVVREDLQ